MLWDGAYTAYNLKASVFDELAAIFSFFLTNILGKFKKSK